MARGLPPDAAIEGALAGDAGRGLRQVHAVDRHGRTAAWTGQNCVEWCGSVAAPGISVAGNMLAGEPTVAATLAAWQANPALDLPERLMAGHGGRRGGRRRPARQAVRRHGADHHRGLPRPQPAGGRQPRAAAGTPPAARHLAGRARAGPRRPAVARQSRRASSTSTRSRRAGSRAASTCGSDASRPRNALADWSRVSNGHDPPDHGARNSSGGDSRLLRRRVAAQLLAATAVAAALGSASAQAPTR